MKRRVELLAPAGNYDAFIGALNAGADAVYLGGEKFGARAYADNFSTEEICLMRITINRLRNERLGKGQYTDAADDMLLKLF